MEEYFLLIVVFLIGLVFLLAGLLMFKNDSKIKLQGKRTLANVIEVKEEKSRDGISYRLVLEFKTNKGIITQELDYSS